MSLESTRHVGVLAVQGAFIEHEHAFERAGFKVSEIRQLRDLDNKFDALVFPGGESTVQRKLLKDLNLQDSLWNLIDAGTPVFATCAGLILLAKEVDGAHNPLGRLDIAVTRNAYGRQLGSFTTCTDFAGRSNVSQTFIRAPRIDRVLDKSVDILSSFDGYVTAVRQNNIIALSWHPELNENEMLLPDLLHNQMKNYN